MQIQQNLQSCKRLQEVVAYKSSGHNGPNFISLAYGFVQVKIQFQEKNHYFPSLALPMNAIKLGHLIIQFPLYYLSSGRLQEVKHKRKFQTFGSSSV